MKSEIEDRKKRTMWNYQRQENTISEMSPFMGNFNNRLKKRSLNLKIMALESIQKQAQRAYRLQSILSTL